MKPDRLNRPEQPECEFSVELLSAYIDNELNENERHVVEEHLRHCSSCQKIVEQFKTLDTSLREVEFEEPSREFVFNLKKNVMEKIKKRHGPVIWKFLPVLLPVAAAAVLVLIITGRESLENPVGMKNRIGILLASDETPAQTEKIDVVIPKPGIVAKTRSLPPAPSRAAAEKKAVADKEAEVTYESAEIPAAVSGTIAQEKRAPVVVRAMVDSTGRILNVATGNTITPQEDTTISRLLKGQQLAPPTVRGKPTQMVVEFVADEKDSNNIK